MSGEDIIPVRAVELGENFCLYFVDDDDDDDDDELECDALSEEKILQHRVFRNVNRQLLVFRPDLQLAAFENVTDQEMRRDHRCDLLYQSLFTNPILTLCMHTEGFEHPSHTNCGMHFNMHCFKTTTPSGGVPVAFSIQIQNKNYYMCCEEKEIGKPIVQFKEGKVPKDIPQESNFIFFKKTFTSCSNQAFKFEYALKQGMFLAFENEGYLRKLILKKMSSDDEVDETMKFNLNQNESYN